MNAEDEINERAENMFREDISETIGNYTKIPFRMVASIAAAMLYLVSPLDVVPDWVPFGGLLDDALVLAAIFVLSRRDLDEYTKWAKPEMKK